MVIIKQRSDPSNSEMILLSFRGGEPTVRIISITKRPRGRKEASKTGRDFCSDLKSNSRREKWDILVMEWKDASVVISLTDYGQNRELSGPKGFADFTFLMFFCVFFKEYHV